MPRSSKTFRVFISSTFTDFEEERNVLHQKVFPVVANYCRKKGAHFQAVDLRWGISEEAALDQKTVQICMDEIKKCQRLSPKPNFLMLIGNRYGWQPLPPKIKKTHFEKILIHYQNDSQKVNELNRWYALDQNAIPEEYRLQPVGRDSVSPDSWLPIEKKLKVLLQEALEVLEMNDYIYNTSATEQEIYEGLLNVPEAKEHVFSYIRNLPSEGLTSQEKGIYFDTNEFGELDEESHEKLNKLKKKTINTVLPENLSMYHVSLQEGKLPHSYLVRFRKDVLRNLITTIQNELVQLEKINEHDRSIQFHEHLQQEHAESFLGKKDEIKKIAKIIMGNSGHHAFLIHGASGAGKTSIMAKLAANYFPSDYTVFSRFAGADAKLVSMFEMLKSFYYQIANRYKVPYSEISEPNKIAEVLIETLKQTKQEKIILFIDAIDQLRDWDLLKRFISLLENQDVRIVFSTITDHPSYHQFSSISQLVSLEDLSREDAEGMLNHWLANQGRTLQPFQKEQILNLVADCPSPLYLRLIYEKARVWKSYSTHFKLGKNGREMIEIHFKSLVEDSHFGSQLVENSLGYLAAARYGLNEDEIIGLLTANDDVYTEFLSSSKHEPPTKELPTIIWSRLYFELEPYLTEIEVSGSILITFYHRQLRDVAKSMYVTDKKYYELSCYFSEQPIFERSFGTSRKTVNVRQIMELPFQLLKSKNWKELENFITDFDMIEGAFLARIESNLLNDYRLILDTAKNEVNRSLLNSFFQFIRTHGVLLRNFPDQVFQMAINEPEESNVASRARKIALGRSYFALQKSQKQASTYFHEMTNTPSSKGEIKLAVWPANREQIITCTTNTIHLWDMMTGVEEAAYTSSNDINAIEMSADGKLLAVANADHSVMVLTPDLYEWGRELQVSSKILQLVWSNFNAQPLLAIVEDSVITIWNVETGATLHSISSGADQWRHCSWGHSHKQLLAVTSYEELCLIDLQSQEIIKKLSHPQKKKLEKFYMDEPHSIKCYWDIEKNFAYTLSLGEITKWNLKGGWRDDYTLFISKQVDNKILPEKDLVLTRTNQEIILWKLSSGKIIFTFEKPDINEQSIISLSPDGKQFIVSMKDHTFTVYYDLVLDKGDDLGNVPLYSNSNASHGMSFFKKLFYSDKKIFSSKTKKINNIYTNEWKHDVLSAKMKPDESKIARGMKTTIEIWDRVAKQWFVITPRGCKEIHTLKWIAEKRILFGSRHSIQLMDTDTFRIHWKYSHKENEIRAIAVHPNKKDILIRDQTGALYIGTFTAPKLNKIATEGQAVTALTWTNHADEVWIGAGNALGILNVKKDKIKWIWNKQDEQVKKDETIIHLDWSREQNLVVLCTNKGTVIGYHEAKSMVHFSFMVTDFLEKGLVEDCKFSFLPMTSLIAIIIENKCILFDYESGRKVAMWITETKIHDFRVSEQKGILLYEGMNQRFTQLETKI